MNQNASGQRRLPFLILIAVCLLLVSCTGVDPQRASADLATVRWFEPMTRAYIEADPKLDEQAKATHLRGLDVWKARVEQDAQLAGVLK